MTTATKCGKRCPRHASFSCQENKKHDGQHTCRACTFGMFDVDAKEYDPENYVTVWSTREMFRPLAEGGGLREPYARAREARLDAIQRVYPRASRTQAAMIDIMSTGSSARLVNTSGGGLLIAYIRRSGLL